MSLVSIERSQLQDYWLTVLAGFDVPTPLVIDNAGTDGPPDDITYSWQKRELRAGDASDMNLHLAWAVVLSRYSDQKDILYGVRASGAKHAVPLRLHVSSASTIRELKKHLQEQLEAAQQHRAPVAEIRQFSDVPDELPLFHSVIAGKNTEPDKFAEAPLVLSLRHDDENHLYAYYAPDRFEAEAIGRLLGHIETVMYEISAMPTKTVSGINILTREEKKQILTDWNATSVSFPDKCLHVLFEEKAAENPDATAVCFREESLSYGELDRRANQLAHYLRARGIGPDVLVGVCMERSLEMVVALYGILKAGGAYVPIDPGYPQERLAFMLKDTAVPVLLTQQSLLENLPEHTAEVVALDSQWQRISQEPDTKPESNVTPDHLAYVIFTSGSTGRPKGAVLNHRGRVNNFADFNRRYAIGDKDKILALSSLSFDMSAYDIFGALMAGGTVVMVPGEAKLNPARWSELVRKHRITVWHSVPALLEMYVNHIWDQEELYPNSLRLALLGGDWIPVTLPDRLKKITEKVHVVSMGGATECSMDSTIYDIDAASSAWSSIPYGAPMANQLSYVLDRNFNPVPLGVPGELYLGGIGVGRGYFNRPELTAERFVPNPFSGVAGDRMYRTGDLARWMPDGNLELLGRIDFQVKIRGYRVELGEIEQAICRSPNVARAVVTLRDSAAANSNGKKQLVAFVVPQKGTDIDKNALRQTLKSNLPDYMIPTGCMVLEKLPLNANGKIDRKALAKFDWKDIVTRAEFRAPENEVQLSLTRIWEKLLHMERISISDNFFDIGGHSLLAVELFEEIRREFGKSLLPDVLVTSPTIEELSDKITKAGWNPEYNGVVALQPHGDRPPFFCVPGALGGVMYMSHLAHCLDRQPFYGLRPQDLHLTQPPEMTVEDIAARLIAEMRSVQPEGPYYLGGHSFGCAVAFEMACQLQKAEEEIGLLVFFDYVAGEIPLRPDRSLRGKFRDGIIEILFRTGILRLMRKYLDKKEASAELWHKLFDIPLINVLAEKQYRPDTFAGQITLLRAEEEKYDAKLGLLRRAEAGVNVLFVPGDHNTLFRDPHVKSLAETLADCLHQAYSDERVSSKLNDLAETSR